MTRHLQASAVLVAFGVIGLPGVPAAWAQKAPPENSQTPSALSVPGSEVRGAVQTLSTDKNTITLLVVVTKGSPAKEETFDLAKETLVFFLDGKTKTSGAERKLTDVTKGMTISVRLSPEPRVVRAVVVPPISLQGTFESGNQDARAITIVLKEGTKTFSLAENAQVVIDEEEWNLRDLFKGTTVTLRMSADRKVVGGIIAQGPAVQGLVKHATADAITLTFRMKNAFDEDKTYRCRKTMSIRLPDGNAGTLQDLKEGMRVSAWLTLDERTIRSIAIMAQKKKNQQ